ncbi:MAG: hypothetical protein IJS32_06000 [Kiritimatiellae bacterium]|nr:hypothetical protein [Kiritimatiellia bacterium]
MKRILPFALCVLSLPVAAARGDGWVPPGDCWNGRADAPPTKLSDLGVVGFLSHARVVCLDAKLDARLAEIRTKMEYPSIPESVISGKEKIPATLAEAAVYLGGNVCMAYPPVLCVDAGDAFFFSGGTSTGPVHDFSSGMAVMRENGAIWTW